VSEKEDCAAAEWSVSRVYGNAACSVNATVMLRRDVASADGEWTDRLGYVRLRLNGGVESHVNELLLRPDMLVALRDFMESPEAGELVEWVLAMCHAKQSGGHWENAGELLEQVEEGEAHLPSGEDGLAADEDESDEQDSEAGEVAGETLPPFDMDAEWTEQDYANATHEALIEHAHGNWDDDYVLSQVNAEFMSEREPDSWAHLDDEVREIRKQLIFLVHKKFPASVQPDADGGVEWPPQALQSRSVALKADCYWYEQGVLSFMGYHVGEGSSLTAAQRRRILDYVLSEQIPKVNDPAYMAQWGDPGSGERLRKMVDSLAAFARNAKLNRHADKSVAVFEWESDLVYLKRTHYRFGTKHLWEWPSTGQ
jgi:hypothetical protein